MKISSRLIGNLNWFDCHSLEQMRQEIIQNWDQYSILQKHSLLDSFINKSLKDIEI